MTKLALAIAVLLLPLFPLSLARHVPLDLPNTKTETETLSLSGGEGQKSVAIPLPSGKPSSFDPRELISVAETPIDGPKATAASRPPMIRIEISFVPVDGQFREAAAAAAARPRMIQIEISFVPADGHSRELMSLAETPIDGSKATTASRPPMIRIEIRFVPVDGHFREAAAAAARPRMIQIEISFVPVDGHVRYPLPPHLPLGHSCRLLCRGPHGGISRLTAIPRGVDTVVSDEHVQRIHAEDKGSVPGGEHRLLQPVRAERMGVNAEGTGEASVMEPVKETETKPPRELRPFASWLPAEGEGGAGRDGFIGRLRGSGR